MISYTRELWQPRERTTSSLVVSFILIVAFANLTAVTANASIPLEPYSPVPITLQTLAVLLCGALLGSRAGALAQLVYIAEGLAGLPVGAGGNSGLPWLLGPTGGYVIGFVAAAFVTGLMVERGWGDRIWRLAVAMVVGNVVIYLLGVPWLYFSVFVGAGGFGGHRKRNAPLSHRRCAKDRRRRRRGALSPDADRRPPGTVSLRRRPPTYRYQVRFNSSRKFFPQRTKRMGLT